jgi:hypothetical protein
MLVIRPEQLEALRKALDERLVEEISAYLKEHHAATIDETPLSLLRRRVAYGVERGRAHGLTTNASLGWFVAMMFELGPAFDEHPRLRERLRDETIPAVTRIAALLEATTDEEWEEVEASSAAGAWPDHAA